MTSPSLSLRVLAPSARSPISSFLSISLGSISSLSSPFERRPSSSAIRFILSDDLLATMIPVAETAIVIIREIMIISTMIDLMVAETVLHSLPTKTIPTTLPSSLARGT